MAKKLAKKKLAKKKPAKKKSWGGLRPGSGRPALFAGAREKVTLVLTTQLRRRIETVRRQLEAEHGAKATESAAVEHLVRKGLRQGD